MFRLFLLEYRKFQTGQIPQSTFDAMTAIKHVEWFEGLTDIEPIRYAKEHWGPPLLSPDRLIVSGPRHKFFLGTSKTRHLQIVIDPTLFWVPSHGQYKHYQHDWPSPLIRQLPSSIVTFHLGWSIGSVLIDELKTAIEEIPSLIGLSVHISIADTSDFLNGLGNIPHICVWLEEDDREPDETRPQRIEHALGDIKALPNIKSGLTRALLVFMVSKEEWNATIGLRPPAIIAQSWSNKQTEVALPLVYPHYSQSSSYNPPMADIAEAHLRHDSDTILAYDFEPPSKWITPPGSSFLRVTPS